MPGFVQHYTETGYGYMDPWVGQVRNAVPLIDASVRRIEPYIPPVIQTTDNCIDSACATAQKQAELLREKKAEVEVKALGMREAATSRMRKVAEESVILGHIQTASVAVVERSELMVDRLLPPTETETSQTPMEHGALMRAVQIPKHAWERTTRLVMLKISVLVALFSTSVESTRRYAEEQKLRLANFTTSTRRYAEEQKLRLVNFTTSSCGKVTSYASETVEAGRLALQKRWALTAGRAEAITLWCNDRLAALAVRLRLAEVRSYTAVKFQWVKKTALTLADSAASRAYKVALSVVGEDRAAAVFQRIRAYTVQEKPKQT